MIMSVQIRVFSLKKKMVKTQALNGISINFSDALMHGVIGPEGAGKTTLFRHLAGLLKPNGGHIEYFQNEQPVSFSELRPRIAYMPQQQSLYPDLSIEEHLEFFRELYGLNPGDYKEKRERLLQITRLSKFTDRPAGKLTPASQ